MITTMITIMLLVPSDYSKTEPVIEDVPERQSYTISKDSIDYYPLPEIMAAIAYHECGNLSKLERWLVMEAFHNRIQYNFNNNGATVKDQLLAPKQFTGLWKFRPEEFKYDNSNKVLRENKQMAEYIISGVRASSRTIFYWAGTYDLPTKHGRWVKKNCIKTNKQIKHLFR